MKRSAGIVWGAFLMLAVAAPAAAQTWRAEEVELAPPEELRAAIRETLSENAIRVIGPEGPLVEIWLRKAIPAKADPPAELGVLYPQFVDGTLVGAARFLADGRDFRRQQTRAGVYTLRYSLLPVDGNHLGVSPQRDFLLLVPAANDTAAEPKPVAELHSASSRASGTTHPSIWSLQQPERGDVPIVSHHADEDLWVLSFEVTLEGGKTQRLALVVVGHAAEA
jgi:hypothetical protein